MIKNYLRQSLCLWTLCNSLPTWPLRAAHVKRYSARTSVDYAPGKRGGPAFWLDSDGYLSVSFHGQQRVRNFRHKMIL